jgi:transposase
MESIRDSRGSWCEAAIGEPMGLGGGQGRAGCIEKQASSRNEIEAHGEAEGGVDISASRESSTLRIRRRAMDKSGGDGADSDAIWSPIPSRECPQAPEATWIQSAKAGEAGDPARRGNDRQMVSRDLAEDKKNAERRGATVIFVDESGFDLSPHVSRGWAPVGETPVVKFPLRGGRLSAISGVTMDGRVYFRMNDGAVKAGEVATFLKHILRQIRGPIVLIWDGIPTHRAGEVKRLIDAEGGRLQVHRLPPYAPELNPDEQLWNWLKNKELVNCVHTTLHELSARLSKAIRTIRCYPEIVRSFYLATPLACQFEKIPC